MHKKRTIIAAIAALSALGGTAIAATHAESHWFVKGAPSNYLAINKTTCKFLVPEIDVQPSSHERYARAEDSRDDVKLSCLTNRKPPRAQLLYKSVFAVGQGTSVTASCAPGYYVTGGGSQSEVQGSYPVGNDSWTVTRDPRSPAILGVTAICVRVVG